MTLPTNPDREAIDAAWGLLNQGALDKYQSFAAGYASGKREGQAELDIALDALNAIAAWREGETVTKSFDEPSAAATARDALTKLRGTGAVLSREPSLAMVEAGIMCVRDWQEGIIDSAAELCLAMYGAMYDAALAATKGE